MMQTSLDRMIVHLFCRLSSDNDDIIFRKYIIFQFVKPLSEIPFNAISRDRISNFFPHRKSDAKMFLPRFFPIVNNELAISKRLTCFKYTLKFSIVFDTKCLFQYNHLAVLKTYTLSEFKILIVLVIVVYNLIHQIDCFTKLNKTTDVIQWPKLINFFYLFDGGEPKLYVHLLFSSLHENRVTFFFFDFLVEMFVSFFLHLPKGIYFK